MVRYSGVCGDHGQRTHQDGGAVLSTSDEMFGFDEINAKLGMRHAGNASLTIT